MGDIVAEFAVPFIFSISSLASLDNANSTAVYVSKERTLISGVQLSCLYNTVGSYIQLIRLDDKCRLHLKGLTDMTGTQMK
jgi:hypothetical protein